MSQSESISDMDIGIVGDNIGVVQRPVSDHAPTDHPSPARTRGTAPGAVSGTTNQHPLAPGADTDHRFDGTGHFGPVVPEIVDHYRAYKRYEISRLRLRNQAFSECYYDTNPTLPKEERRKIAGKMLTQIESAKDPLDIGDPILAGRCLPYFAAMEQLEGPMEDAKKVMCRLVRRLPPPVLDFQKAVRGLAEFSLAKLIGEVGDVSMYRSVQGLRRRCGLIPYNGKAASTWRTSGGLTADEWVKIGSSPRRLAAILIIAKGIAAGGKVAVPRLQVGEDIDARTDLGTYEKMFHQRLRYEAERDPEHLRVNEKSPDQESYSLHAARRATRYTMQKFLLNLFLVCRKLRED